MEWRFRDCSWDWSWDYSSELCSAHGPGCNLLFTSPVGRGRRAASGEGLRPLETPLPPHPNPLPQGEREFRRMRGCVSICARAEFLRLRVQAPGEQALLGVQPVFRLVEHHRL